jgi:hypothetical protein
VDSDGDLSLTDAVSILGYLFLGEGGEDVCEDAADTNDSGRVDLADAVFLLVHLFAGGASAPEPAEACGEDPTDDSLDCATYACPSSARTLVDGAEAVVLVIDRSERMTGEPLNVAKRQAAAFIWAHCLAGGGRRRVLRPAVLTLRATGTYLGARKEEKESLVRSIAEAEPGNGSCPQVGLLAALTSFAQSQARRRKVLDIPEQRIRHVPRLGGGGPVPPGDSRRRRRPERRPRVRFTPSGSSTGARFQEQFMLGLATENGGCTKSSADERELHGRLRRPLTGVAADAFHRALLLVHFIVERVPFSCSSA